MRRNRNTSAVKATSLVSFSPRAGIHRTVKTNSSLRAATAAWQSPNAELCRWSFPLRRSGQVATTCPTTRIPPNTRLKQSACSAWRVSRRRNPREKRDFIEASRRCSTSAQHPPRAPLEISPRGRRRLATGGVSRELFFVTFFCRHKRK